MTKFSMSGVRALARFVKGTIGALAIFSMLLAAPHAALAATPAAGTLIGNQASATYTDASSAARSVTSNVVTAVVAQVASLTLTQNTAKTVVAGGQVVYPLTLTNTGNGPDTFSLGSSNSGGFSFGSVVFYADVNGDGVADNTTPITSSTLLAQGESFKFVAVGTVPTSAASTAVNTLLVTATSGFASSLSATVTDTTTVTSNAVINVTKSISAASGAPTGPTGSTYTVSLSYSNTGNSAAGTVTLVDPLPAGMTYVAGSGRWSAFGATVLTDATLDIQTSGLNSIDYSYAAPQVKAVINSVAAGQSGVVSFQVTINLYDKVTATGQLAGVLNNIANYAYNDGAVNIAAVNTNVFAFTVTPVSAVTATGTTVTSVTQGGTAIFNNVIKNNGNSTDSFDIVVGSTFPAGSSYALFQADGVTPLLDTNGNGIPDTGPLASGATYTVVLKVTLPTSLSSGGPFSVTKTATSKNDPTQSASATDTLQAITPNSVDLTNNTATLVVTTPGFGTTTVGETTAQVTTTTLPGMTARFTLYVNNTSAVADTYDLAASTVGSTFPGALPTGWSVVFRNAAGAVISNSGVVNGGGNVLVYADVTVPANQVAMPTGQDLYFRVKSPTTNAYDVIHDLLIIGTVRNIKLIPNNNGQVFPGGSVVYLHTLSNNGNVTENAGGGGSAFALAQTNSQATFSSIVYIDANKNGILDSTDPVFTTTTLGPMLPGASVGLLVKVSAASGAAVGVIDITQLTITTSGTINGASAPAAASVSDTTNVIAGNLSLLKEQALDVNCNNGGGTLVFSAANITSGALPNVCIRYRLTVTNMGTADALNVVVSDATPVNTTYQTAVPAFITPVGTMSTATIALTNGSVGTISTSSPGFTLIPSAAAVLNFGVRINP